VAERLGSFVMSPVERAVLPVAVRADTLSNDAAPADSQPEHTSPRSG
jgi:hypothetical protein